MKEFFEDEKVVVLKPGKCQHYIGTIIKLLPGSTARINIPRFGDITIAQKYLKPERECFS